MTLAEALDRTLLLMRDEVGNAVPDTVLINALTSTTVALVIDMANATSHAAQSAFVTAAILMARSAHRVFLVAPEIDLIGTQPPLPAGQMVAGLVAVGRDLLPGVDFEVGVPDGEIDLVVAFGDTRSNIPARQRIRANAEPWAGRILLWDNPIRWGASAWPLGGLAAGALAAGEAFKIAMRTLEPHALNPAMMAALFAPSDTAVVQLGPPGSSCTSELGETDFVSGGAINSAVLYALARLPAVRLRGRVIEPDSFAPSNLNRYALMLRSHNNLPKADVLSSLLGGGILLTPSAVRYEPEAWVEPLASQVVVGVDDIPTRWHVQRAGPDWLAIGASTHWSAMTSFHEPGLACAQCLHPEDEPGDAPIPTQACVSFWAGLLTAAYVVRRAAERHLPAEHQHIYFTPFRPEAAVSGAVGTRPACPTCGPR